MDSVSLIQQFVADRINAAGLAQTAASAELVVEEIAVNIVKYGGKEGDAGEIGICLEIEEPTVVLEITDNGRAFNPLDRTDPDTGLGLEEREVGGLGIFLVKQLSRDVAYSRSKGINCLTVTL